ncbi:glycosyltransferase family 4 protein [Polaribacter sp.]|uniref:glycosyltransferase family 4 protein n=1 Tax=Polaribacter sp. TaxID=1920175 RepID=UPI003F6CE753
MKKLIILQSITPDYRKLFFETIKKNLGDKFILYSGDSYFENSLRDDKSIEKISVKNYFLFNKILIQSHFIHFIFTKGILVLEMNPRILTNWIILFFRKFLSKKTVLWGHAWPRKGKDSKTEFVRKIMKFLGDEIIVYTDKQQAELLQQFPSKKIVSAPNAVISSSKMETNFDIKNSNNFIYVGRLTKLKKPLVLLEAFHKIIDKLPEESKLIIIGSGNESKSLENYVSDNNLEKRVLLKGHISNYNELKNYYDSSFFSVSPGYVGLSITQSFGFGVPMLVSKTENHSPEIEAFQNNKNGLYFETDSLKDLGIKMLDVLDNKEIWIKQRKNIVNFCKENYSIEAMAEVFINLTEH